MTADRLQIARAGEKFARDFLKEKGYSIIEENYRTKYSEIDLIARKKKVLVFVEVRTKTNADFGLPEETIKKEKIGRLIRAAAAWTAKKRWQGPYRIDAISVILDKNFNLENLQHYENITSVL